MLKWTTQEVELLKNNYGKISLNELKLLLPRFNSKAIYQKAKSLGLVIKKSKSTWSSKQVEILKEYYGKLPIEELQKTKLPDKSISQIYNYAFKIGLKKVNPWPKEYIDILKEYYGKETIEQIAKRLPGRSHYDIVQKASRLGLSNRGDWPEEEINILREYYPEEGIGVLSRLPGRSKSAVQHMARRLGIKRNNRAEWTEEKDEIIRKYYTKESAEEVAKRLPGISPALVVKRANELGIIKRSKGAPWTQEETDILVELYGKIPMEELLKKLPNRSYNAITTQASLLNLTAKIETSNKIVTTKKRTTNDCENELNEELILNQAEAVEMNETEQDKSTFDLRQDSNEELLEQQDLGHVKKKRKHHKRKHHKKRTGNILKVEEIWTEDEDNIIRLRYNKEDISLLLNKLPGHSLKSIRRRAKFLGVDKNKKIINWSDEDIKNLKDYYPIEGTAVVYRLKNHSLNSIKSVVKILNIKLERINEPWEFEEDLLACKFYLEHIDNWSKKEIVNELLDIFISNGYLKHKQKTLHMKLANCSYIHTGIGLEHASKQNIKAYDKLTGNNWFKKLLVKIKRFFKKLFKWYFAYIDYCSNEYRNILSPKNGLFSYLLLDLWEINILYKTNNKIMK